MNRKFAPRTLFYALVVYTFFAFGWWGYLLYYKTEVTSTKTIKIAENEFFIRHKGSTTGFDKSEAYLNTLADARWQEWIILIQGLVLIFIIVIGMWQVNHSFHREADLANQQRNFLLSITHELKSPLSSIKLVLETFRKHELPRKHIEKFSANALNDTNRLQTLVENLLLAARMESDTEHYLESLDLKLLVDEIATQFQDKYPDLPITFRHDEKEYPLVGDRSLLTSLVTNLIENAIKYSAGTPIVEIHLYQEAKKIHLNIADQGIGIPNADKKKVFEKFYRVGNEDTRRAKGTGLGLYIVKEVVEAHSGTISISDNLPRGTVFKMKFPIV